MNTVIHSTRVARFRRCQDVTISSTAVGATGLPPRGVSSRPGRIDGRPAAPGEPDSARQIGIGDVIALWRAADLDLSPVVGRRGALAILRRALASNQAAFGWLYVPDELQDFHAAIGPLCASFADRAPDEAQAAACALWSTFRDLLSSLVGEALAEQVLRSADDHLSASEIDLAGTR